MGFVLHQVLAHVDAELHFPPASQGMEQLMGRMQRCILLALYQQQV
jgi:hypothetical protein